MKALPTLRIFTCPQCHKHRMQRPESHVISTEMTEYNLPNGGKISLLKDICYFCQMKNQKKYFTPKKADIKKILQALHEQKPIDADKSLEDSL